MLLNLYTTKIPKRPGISPTFKIICLSGNLQLNAFAEIVNNTGFPLEFIPYLIRGGNDMFFQSVPSLSVIPVKTGIQKLIDSLSPSYLRINSF